MTIDKGTLEADAYLKALLDYSGSFYGTAITYGVPAAKAADAVAHVERAARNLHRLASAPSSREAVKVEDDDRPISHLRRDTGEPLWQQVNDAFERHGLPSPDWRFRDELVGWLQWARYGERALASPVERPVPVLWQWRYWYSSGEPGIWLNERRDDADDLLESGVLIREEKRPLYAAPTPSDPYAEGMALRKQADDIRAKADAKLREAYDADSAADDIGREERP